MTSQTVACRTFSFVLLLSQTPLSLRLPVAHAVLEPEVDVRGVTDHEYLQAKVFVALARAQDGVHDPGQAVAEHTAAQQRQIHLPCALGVGVAEGSLDRGEKRGLGGYVRGEFWR